MNRLSKLRSVGLSLLVPAIVAAAVPFTFTSGTPIRSSEVNANFAALDSRVASANGGTRWVNVPGGSVTVYSVPLSNAYRSTANLSGLVMPALRSDGGVLWGFQPETGEVVPLVGAVSFTPALWFESTNCTGRPIISGLIPPPGGTIALIDGGVLARRPDAALRPLAIQSLLTSSGCSVTTDYSAGLLPSDFAAATPPAVAPGPYRIE